MVRRSGMNITVLALDRGEAPGNHSVQEDTLDCLLENETHIPLGDDTVIVKDNQTVLMPGGKPDSLKAERSFEN